MNIHTKIHIKIQKLASCPVNCCFCVHIYINSQELFTGLPGIHRIFVSILGLHISAEKVKKILINSAKSFIDRKFFKEV